MSDYQLSLMVVKCAGCGADLPAVEVGGDMQQDFVMLSLCGACRPPAAPPVDVDKIWEDANRRIMEAAARGEILDTNKNPVPAVMVEQLGNGQYITHWYAIDTITDKLIERVE